MTASNDLVSNTDKRDINAQVWILLGSNCGDKVDNIKQAILSLQREITIQDISDTYTSAPYAAAGEDYANAVIVATTHRNLETLEKNFKEIEVNLGRDARSRELHFVPIDIDIIVYGKDIVRQLDYDREYFKKGVGQLCRNGFSIF